MRRLLRKRSELVGLVAALLAVVLYVNLTGGSRPGVGVYAIGLVGGCVLALHAVGIVLVYRANRVINFAQIQIGVIASSLFYEAVSRRILIRGAMTVCPPCFPDPKTVGDLQDLSSGAASRAFSQVTAEQAENIRNVALSEIEFPAGLSVRDFVVSAAPGWLVQATFWISLVLSVVIAALLVWAVYLLIVSRFRSAPRLVLTVITIAAGAFAQVLGRWVLEQAFGKPSATTFRSGDGGLPIDLHFTMGDVVFSAADGLAVLVLVAVATGLTLYFRRSRMGIVMRGAAENPQRAETLGVPVARVTSRAWMIAGLLSGLASVLSVARFGQASIEGVSTLVRVLGAATVGGLVGVPLAIAGGLSVGVMDQLTLASSGDKAAVDGVLLVFIVALLLAQRARASRADIEAQSSWLASRELRPIPSELRHLAPVKRTLRILAVVGVAITLGYPWFMSPSQTVLGTNTLCLVIAALSLLVLTGWAGQISLAQMAFAGMGAWVAAVAGVPFLLAIPLAGIAGAVIAALVGIPAFRLRGQHLAISTLALAVATSSLVLGPKYLGKRLPSGLERPVFLGVDLEDDRAFYYLVLVFVIAAIVATIGMRRSRTARALIACKDNEQAAQGFGISLLKARITAFAISGFMAAVAGSLIAFTQHGVEPATFGPTASIDLFLVTLIGGLGSVAGPVMGALYIGFLEVLSGTGFAQVAELLLNPAIGVLLLLMLAPGGVSRVVWSARDAWLRRLADRHRIIVPSLIADRADNRVTIPIKVKSSPSGGTAFVPTRYRLDDQWMDERRVSERARAVEKASARG